MDTKVERISSEVIVGITSQMVRHLDTRGAIFLNGNRNWCLLKIFLFDHLY